MGGLDHLLPEPVEHMYSTCRGVKLGALKREPSATPVSDFINLPSLEDREKLGWAPRLAQACETSKAASARGLRHATALSVSRASRERAMDSLKAAAARDEAAHSLTPAPPGDSPPARTLPLIRASASQAAKVELPNEPSSSSTLGSASGGCIQAKIGTGGRVMAVLAFAQPNTQPNSLLWVGFASTANPSAMGYAHSRAVDSTHASHEGINKISSEPSGDQENPIVGVSWELSSPDNVNARCQANHRSTLTPPSAALKASKSVDGHREACKMDPSARS